VTKPAGRLHSQTVVLSKARLSNWNQTRTNFVGQINQIKVSPQKRRVLSSVKQKLAEADVFMQRVAELQKNPMKNRAALIKASSELRRFEKQIKGLQQKLGSPQHPWDKRLGTTGDDAQLANIDLENATQMQQQTIPPMSQVSKILHATAMAIIRNLG
jgi:hypothetical protein